MMNENISGEQGNLIGFCEDDSLLQGTQVCGGVYDSQITVSDLRMGQGVEFCLVTDGAGVLCVLNQALECQRGDLYVLNSGVPHGYFSREADHPMTVQLLTFPVRDWFENAWADPESRQFCCGIFPENSPISYAALNSKVYSQVENTLRQILSEVQNRDIQWRDAVQAHLTMLLITVGRYINQAEQDQPVHSREWVHVSAAIRYIQDHCDDSGLTLEAVANSLFISMSHLSRLFQREVGVSFADYVRNLRIQKACALLQNTALKNEEIVRKCGLKDVPSFYRLFKSALGMTPFQYRMSQTTYQNKKGVNTMSIVIEISENLQRGKSKLVKELVEKAISEGVPAGQILNEGLLDGMNVVGEKFKKNEIYVPEVLVAARAMNSGMQILKPLLMDEGVKATGKVCIGTVQGDLHDIGKNLVKMMMEGKGLEVVDLGTDVSPETFVQTAIEQNCKVICCSALLTTTMGVMEEVVKQAEAAGIREKVKIMVGGAPVSEEFCQSIGADRYTSDAASAADAAVELCQ